MCTIRLVSKGFGHRLDHAARSLALAAVAGFVLPVFAQTLDADGAARRDAAVAAARNGDYATAVASLESLRAEFPDDPTLLHDQITVLAWSEDDVAAVVLASPLAPDSTPRYTQLAVAKAARNLREYVTAAAWYDAAIARNPDDIDALAGRMLTAADAGQRDTVHALVDSTAALARESRNLQLARAGALHTVGEHLAALGLYDEVLESAPDDAAALRGKALVLRSMLLPTQALALAEAHPGILSTAEIERLRADEAAIRTRLTSRTPYPEPSVYSGIDESLAYLDAQLAAATTPAARNALLLDRVVALSDANRAEAAIAAFESLPEGANSEQPYVMTSAAKAYLQVHEPETARDLLERALAIQPDNLEARFTLVYALLDLDRPEEAHALAAELTQALPMANHVPGSNVVKGNESRVRAELVAGIADADGNRYEAAQTRFESLLSDAPNNAELRKELANIYRWRGWLDRSLDEYRQVLTMNDDLLSARLAYANAQLEAREYPDVETTLTEVESVYGREPAVRQLADSWEVHNDRELIVTASSGDSSGPVEGANNRTLDMRAYTAPIGYRYRVFVATHDGYAEYPEGDARRRRIGAGLEYRLPRFTATGQLTGSRSEGGQTGFAGTAEYRASDFWTIDGGIELDSDATQLRAYRLGIESDRAYLGARFTPSELASIGFGYDRAEYSDGNTLENLFADGRYRLLTRPRSRLNATGSIGLGRAETSDAPYFSPARGRTVTLGLAHEFRLHRRYERQVNQTVSANTGRYVQHGFDPGSIWSLSYRIDWSINRRHSVSFEALRRGQFFDGLREYSTVGIVSINSRF